MSATKNQAIPKLIGLVFTFLALLTAAIIKEMMDARFVNFGNNVDVETAIINIRETFNIYRGQPWVASSKLQQIRFLYSLFKLSEKDRSDFCTSLIFTAGKEGKRYGPYGKIF